MAYHIACYNEMHNANAKPKVARYRSKCEKPGCDRMIEPGDAFTWTRRQSDTENASSNATADQGEAQAQAPAEQPPQDGIMNMQALAKALKPALEKILDIKSSAVNVQRIEVSVPDMPVKDMGFQHKMFPTLLKAIAARVPIWLAGPSGSGKTTAAMNAAEALGLPFRYTGAVGDQYALMGYNDANGRYVRTQFREAFEHGGVFLWDEVDASDPNALLAFNAALANGAAAFPDAIVEKHPDCVLIAAANTWGHGGTHEYVGRLKLDAAFLKRFACLAWEYDEDLELATCANESWVKRVQQVRKRVKDKGLRVLVTPRESYLGARLLAAGLDQDTVENMTIRSGMTADQWAQVAA
jgi:hypothetical protein